MGSEVEPEKFGQAIWGSRFHRLSQLLRTPEVCVQLLQDASFRDALVCRSKVEEELHVLRQALDCQMSMQALGMHVACASLGQLQEVVVEVQAKVATLNGTVLERLLKVAPGPGCSLAISPLFQHRQNLVGKRKRCALLLSVIETTNETLVLGTPWRQKPLAANLPGTIAGPQRMASFADLLQHVAGSEQCYLDRFHGIQCDSPELDIANKGRAPQLAMLKRLRRRLLGDTVFCNSLRFIGTRVDLSRHARDYNKEACMRPFVTCLVENLLTPISANADVRCMGDIAGMCKDEDWW